MLRRGLYLAAGAIPASWLSAELLLALAQTSAEVSEHVQYRVDVGLQNWFALSLPAWPALIGTLALWSTVLQPRAARGSATFLITAVGLLIGLLQILPLSLINLGESIGRGPFHGLVTTAWFFLCPPGVAVHYLLSGICLFDRPAKRPGRLKDTPDP